MSDPIEYTGTFKTIQDIVDWINNYTPEPVIEPPSEDGTYILKVTVEDGVPTYSWEQKEQN